ncbi:hypothetical protein ABE10_03275, partial [Bacillus toyonensis]|nr:hypothetical protein [Bacillus toyonensis]
DELHRSVGAGRLGVDDPLTADRGSGALLPVGPGGQRGRGDLAVLVLEGVLEEDRAVPDEPGEHEHFALGAERGHVGVEGAQRGHGLARDERVEHLGDACAVLVGRESDGDVLAVHVVADAVRASIVDVRAEPVAARAHHVAGVLRGNAGGEGGVVAPGGRDLVSELGEELLVVPEHLRRHVLRQAVELPVLRAGGERGAEAVLDGVGDLVGQVGREAELGGELDRLTVRREDDVRGVLRVARGERQLGLELRAVDGDDGDLLVRVALRIGLGGGLTCGVNPDEELVRRPARSWRGGGRTSGEGGDRQCARENRSRDVGAQLSGAAGVHVHATSLSVQWASEAGRLRNEQYSNTPSAEMSRLLLRACCGEEMLDLAAVPVDRVPEVRVGACRGELGVTALDRGEDLLVVALRLLQAAACAPVQGEDDDLPLQLAHGLQRRKDEQVPARLGDAQVEPAVRVVPGLDVAGEGGLPPVAEGLLEGLEVGGSGLLRRLSGGELLLDGAEAEQLIDVLHTAGDELVPGEHALLMAGRPCPDEEPSSALGRDPAHRDEHLDRLSGDASAQPEVLGDLHLGGEAVADAQLLLDDHLQDALRRDLIA